MPFKFLFVPLRDSSAAEAELNGFLAQHRVLAVERQWVDAGAQSGWGVCIEFVVTTAGGTATSAGQRGKVDYKNVLSPEEFAVFAKLRDLRKQMAQVEAVPPYTIFTNEQLAAIVRERVQTKTALEQIAGVGEARTEKYGPPILEFLKHEWAEADAPSRTTV